MAGSAGVGVTIGSAVGATGVSSVPAGGGVTIGSGATVTGVSTGTTVSSPNISLRALMVGASSTKSYPSPPIVPGFRITANQSPSSSLMCAFLLPFSSVKSAILLRMYPSFRPSFHAGFDFFLTFSSAGAAALSAGGSEPAFLYFSSRAFLLVS